VRDTAHNRDAKYRDIISFWRRDRLISSEPTLFSACHLINWEAFRRLQHIIRVRKVKRGEVLLINTASRDSEEAFVERHGPKGGELGCPGLRLLQDIAQQDELTPWAEEVLQSISKTRELGLGKAWHCLGEPLRLAGVKDYRDVRSARSPDTAAERARRDRTQKRLLELQQRPVSINLSLLKLGLFSAQPGRIVMSSRKNNTVTGFLQRMRGYHIALWPD